MGRYLQKQRNKGTVIGFVPTMGALHEGHMNLVDTCKGQTGLSVCSIFVNPTQFNDPSDFEKYPVTLEKDLKMLSDAGTSVVFLPSVKEIYPNGLKLENQYDLGDLETKLEGKYRPGHFQGVCQVVDKLLEMTSPDILFMGQKDYQQCMVVQKLIDLKKIPTRLQTCPTVRESSGLAMSSRNMRLSTEERALAARIHETLQQIKSELKPGDTSGILKSAAQRLTDAGFKVDYLEICTANGLDKIDNWDGKTPAIAVVAAFLGNVRLIDNLIIK